ncbi:O-antigen ligase family protein [Desulfolithobacter dissulfuricans]|nr:O-antigen ligase family protein [Desulfolithobacter dissulfuricans]
MDRSWFSSAVILCLVFLYVALVPTTRLLPALGTYDEKRVLECILLVLVCTVVATTPPLCRAWLRLFFSLSPGARAVLGACVLLGFLSSLVAVSVRYALLELTLFVCLFIASLSMAVVRQELGRFFDRVIVLSVLVVGWAYLAGFVAFYVSVLAGSLSFEQRALFWSFSNIRFFSQFQTWTLPLVVLPWFFLGRYPLVKLITVLAGSSWWFLFFVSGTRGTLVAMLAAGVLVAVVFGRRSWPWFKLQALVLLAGLVAYVLIFLVLPEILSVDTSSVLARSIRRDLVHSPGRMTLWALALDMIRQHPLLGLGPMHFACDSNLVASHPHNALLQLASEWGMPVAVTVLLFFVRALFLWIQSAQKVLNREEDQEKMVLCPALLASLSGAAVHALVSGLVVMPLSQVMLVLVAGWMLSLYKGEMQEPSRWAGEIWRKGKICVLVVLVPVFLFAGLAVLSWPGDQARQRFLSSPFAHVHRMPRFWQQGKICLGVPDIIDPRIGGNRQDHQSCSKSR